MSVKNKYPYYDMKESLWCFTEHICPSGGSDNSVSSGGCIADLTNGRGIGVYAYMEGSSSSGGGSVRDSSSGSGGDGGGIADIASGIGVVSYTDDDGCSRLIRLLQWWGWRWCR